MNQIKDISAFFSSRRSISVKNLNYPGPNYNQTMAILKNALRVPDHGKLEPWRIVLISGDHKKNFISIIENRGKEIDIDPLKIEKNKANLLGTPIILAPVDIVCSAFGSGCYDEKQSIGSTVLGTAGIHIFFEL